MNPLEPDSVLARSWKKLKRLHPLAIDTRPLELLRSAPLEQLLDPQFLLDLIPRLGLNDDGLEEMPPELHAACGVGLRIWQYPIQFAPYLVALARLGVRSYLEVGVRHGGTFVATVEYLLRFGALDRAHGIDIMPCPTIEKYAEGRPFVRFARMNTQAPAFGELVASLPALDLALVDANHTEYECRRECAHLVRRARILVLHDISSSDFPGVRTVWEELRALGEHECYEFTQQYGSLGPYMGIGLAVRRPGTSGAPVAWRDLLP